MTPVARKREIAYSGPDDRPRTIGPGGSPPVKRVGFRYDPELATIDVTGFNMAASQKFRDVRRNGHTALVVDDIASTDPWRVRFLEIRGAGDAITLRV